MPNIKSFFSQCIRVWHLLKKPGKTEFTTVAKVAALGLGLVGVLGFAISLIMGFIKI